MERFIKMAGRWRRRHKRQKQGASLSRALVSLGTLAATCVATALPFQQSAAAASRLTCQVSPAEAAEKENLRQAIVAGDSNAASAYHDLVRKHAREQADCRQDSWPRDRAIWLKLYPCDTNFGQIDALFDRIANDGYSQVYLATLANGQVLLPVDDNPTPWPSVARSDDTGSIDLLANAITAGRARGIEVHAWMFSLNFGYAYGQREDRREALATNGRGQTSLDRAMADSNSADGIFVDPYSPIVRRDYQRLLDAVLDRAPAGVVFDYIRYPRLSGTDSVADDVRDLWIYGPASRSAFLDGAPSADERYRRETYLDTGRALAATAPQPTPPPSEPDLQLSNIFEGLPDPSYDSPIEPSPPVYSPPPTPSLPPHIELWQTSVDHAANGIVDFLDYVAAPVRAERRATGAAFFPRGNQAIGSGFDSRLQFWDRFSSSIVWHPMLYGGCNATDCLIDDLNRVRDAAPPGAKVIPVLAGAWGVTTQGRHPPLETQMQAIGRNARHPNVNIDAVSHFSFGWQHPELDRERKFCHL